MGGNLMKKRNPLSPNTKNTSPKRSRVARTTFAAMERLLRVGGHGRRVPSRLKAYVVEANLTSDDS
jgi:hypothetical protein